jgi:hypothetical protein
MVDMNNKVLVIIHYEVTTKIAKHYGMYDPVIKNREEVEGYIEEVCGTSSFEEENPYEEYGTKIIKNGDYEYQISIFDLSSICSEDAKGISWHVFDLLNK